jgi:hypothetical protein
MIENEGGSAASDSSDDTTATDPVRQLKGEMTRKTDKIASQLESMQKSQEQLAALLQQAMAPPPQKQQAKKSDDLDNLMYSDNAKYRQILKDQAAEEVITRINTQNESQRATQNTIAELSREYPELADAENELTKKAVAILKSLPAHEQTMTTAYRFAVKQAAEDLAVKPRSKRDPDEFQGPSYSPSAPRRREQSDKQILEASSGLAEAMGLDMSNVETQKRLVARSKRTWSRNEAPLRIRKGK